MKIGSRKKLDPNEKRFLYQTQEPYIPFQRNHPDPPTKDFYVSVPLGRTEAEREFWSHIEITENHWYWHPDNLFPPSTLYVIWSYTYNPPPEGWYPKRWCKESVCLRPDHMFLEHTQNKPIMTEGEIRNLRWLYET